MISHYHSNNKGITELNDLAEDLQLYSFEPQFMRPAPPIYESKDDDVLWINMEHNYDVLWDHRMCADLSRLTEIRELMMKAFKGPLVTDQQKVCIAILY